MSPCLAVPGSQKKLYTPILDNVADTFLAIKPDLPTPAQITLPLQVASTSTALANEDEFEVKEDATKAEIKRAFVKSLKVKKMNKKILGEFIELVA